MDIKESNAQIEQWINSETELHFYSIVNSSKSTIELFFRNVVINAIKSQPEYMSLLRGRLRSEFGLPDADTKLSEILTVWSKDIVIRNSRKRLTIEMIQADFSNVLSLASAQQITKKGVSLEWLDWLLMRGDKTIIRDYEVSLNTSAHSRTGTAIMMQRKRGKWGVPSQYAGTIRNNWVTRAIDGIPDKVIEDIVFGVVEKQW